MTLSNLSLAAALACGWASIVCEVVAWWMGPI